MQAESSRAAIAPFLAMEVAREANAMQAAGRKIVRLDVGQPQFSAPQRALEAAAKAIAQDRLGYTEALGTGALRQAIAHWYGETYGLDIAPQRVIITTGASGAFTLTFLALFDTGARVAMAAPGYPPYRHILTALGMQAVPLDAHDQDNLQLTPALLQNVSALDGVLVASPTNPTGAMCSRAQLLDLSIAARTAGAAFICDEIYHGLTYETPATSALEIDRDAIVINSFSKFWAMTGWRVGWIVAPERLIKPIERLSQNLTVAPPSISQAAALGALQARDECLARVEHYARNRALLLHELPGLGLPLAAAPDGAFYMLLDISRFGDDSVALCETLLHEAGVALTPGLDFCTARGRSWVRLAYCQPTETIVAGLEQLSRHFNR